LSVSVDFEETVLTCIVVTLAATEIGIPARKSAAFGLSTSFLSRDRKWKGRYLVRPVSLNCRNLYHFATNSEMLSCARNLLFHILNES